MKKKDLLVILTSILLFDFALITPQTLSAQCSVTSWATPSVISNDNSFGTYAFSNATNTSASDNQYAAATATVSVLTGNTQYLKCTGFGWALPLTATICGIEVEVERSATNVGLFTSVRDESVRLVNSGTVTGNNNATNTNWTTSDITETYGSGTNLWGTTWTPSEINANDFGFVFSSRLNGVVSLLPSARIDQVRMRVHYQVSLALQHIPFNLTVKDNAPVMSFYFAERDNVDSVFVEKMISRETFKILKTYTGDDLVASIKFYDHTAIEGMNYYRLRITNKDNSVSYSAVKYVNLETVEDLKFNNPVREELKIRSKKPFSIVSVFSVSGYRIVSRSFGTPQRSLDLSLNHLSSGPHLLVVDEKRFWFIRQ